MIVCGGEALMDFTRQAGGGYAPHPGGSPYNVAVALARQDVPTTFLGQISRDLFGEQLLAHLQNSGVDISLVSRSARPSTLAFVDTLGQAEPQYAFYAQGAADVELLPEGVSDTPEAQITHVGSISLMQEPCGQTWEDYVQRASGLLSFDPNIRPALIPDREVYLGRFGRVLARTGLLKLSSPDLEWLFPEQAEPLAAHALLERGPAVVIVTGGARGATLYTARLTLQQPAFRVTVADTVGAGDTFTAAFLAELYRRGFPPGDPDQLDPDQLDPGQLDPGQLDPGQLQVCLRWAAASAALNCQKTGTQPPTFAQTQTFLSSHGLSPQEFGHAQI